MYNAGGCAPMLAYEPFALLGLRDVPINLAEAGCGLVLVGPFALVVEMDVPPTPLRRSPSQLPSMETPCANGAAGRTC